MKIKALVIAPYRGLLELINNLVTELPEFEITAIQGDLSEGLHAFKERYMNRNFDVVISRGGTAKLLRKHISQPVVEIQVSGFDILRILTLLKGYQSKIKIIGFPNIVQGFAAVSNLMNIEIPYAEINHENDVESALRKAKEEGVIVVVGDNVTTRLANELGLQGVLITSGRESVLDAFYSAKQTFRILNSSNIRNSVFEELLDQVDQGFAIVYENGEFEYANESFKKHLQLTSQDSEGDSLFDHHPYFLKLIKDLDGEQMLNEPLTLYETGTKLSVSAKRLNLDPNKKSYLFKLKVSGNDKSRLNVIYHKKTNESSYPPIITSGEEFKKALLYAEKQFKKNLPVVIYGEMGSGKMIFVDLLYQSDQYQDGTMVEIVIHDGSEESCQRLQKVLQNAQPDFLYYMRGLEHIPTSFQRKLLPLLTKLKGHFVISFMRSLEELKVDQLLDSKLVEMLNQDTIFLPPLRDNTKYFEELVRTFIVQYNEKYGKQVVGIRPAALEILRSHPWKGNFIELKEITEQFVRNSTGEYIEEDALRILHSSNGSYQNQIYGEVDRINLNRTLEEIEKEIIRIVLEEESMNQSRAAKRLGINRSTLWRKIADNN